MNPGRNRFRTAGMFQLDTDIGEHSVKKKRCVPWSLLRALPPFFLGVAEGGLAG